MKTDAELLNAAYLRDDPDALAELERIAQEDPEEWQAVCLYALTRLRDALARHGQAQVRGLRA